MTSGVYIHKPLSEETKRRMSVSRMGHPVSQITRKKLRKANLGKKHTKESRDKMSKSHTGKPLDEKHKESMRRAAHKGRWHHNWKGRSAGYGAVHCWVRSKKGTPNYCENCKNCKLKARQYHWANKSGKYKRILSDWFRLCVPCHYQYDKSNRCKGKGKNAFIQRRTTDVER